VREKQQKQQKQQKQEAFLNSNSERNHDTYIYPGSFDPPTNGHLDIIARAARLCGRLIVAVGRNREKKTMFSVDERLDMLLGAVSGIGGNGGNGGSGDSGGNGSSGGSGDSGANSGNSGNIDVVGFSGLLVDFAGRCGASVIVKGLRAMSDFEYEFQMALLNKHMDDELETIFMMTNIQHTYLSSSAVKELALNGADVSGLVPANVYAKLKAKIDERNI
jgi:pantetheine-phosphate adenylyltransferase